MLPRRRAVARRGGPRLTRPQARVRDVRRCRLMSVPNIVADNGPLAGLIGVAVTLHVNGTRAERTRRRELHARAIEAVVAYLQMPYAIRRRRHEPEHRSAERVRLTEAFTKIQAELASCEAVMRSDGDPLVRDGYATLVATLREHAGEQA